MLGDLKQTIEKLIDSKPALKQFKNQLLIDITSEGLRIQIVDEQNRPMFDTSSAELKTSIANHPSRDWQGAEYDAKQAEPVGTYRRSAIQVAATRAFRIGSFPPIAPMPLAAS